MGQRRKVYTAEFKARVALAAIKGAQTVAQLATQYQVHPTQIQRWKKQFLEGAEGVLADVASAHNNSPKKTETAADLMKQIAHLQRQVGFLKRR
ncbi:MAG: transposase [Planctomycetes bacterium]|nr:transposase [Planctomycetota bacterium]